MPLVLEFVGQSSQPVEVFGLIPTALRGKSLPEIARVNLLHGNRRVPLADLFRISGDTKDDQILFTGDLEGVHGIGARLDGGLIRVEGSAGRHLGSQMSSGEIHVAGDAADFAGVEMRGGLIHIRGGAGDLVGGTYPGSRRGMLGGSLLIEGSVGAELGRSMRRGLIAVGGSTGQAPGYDMIAGTIAVFGQCGPRPGANMRRGSILLFGKPPGSLLPSFRFAGRAQPGFVVLLQAELHRLQFPHTAAGCQFDYYNGDLLALGKGEILVAAD